MSTFFYIFYKVTDRIWIILEDNTIGYLTIPNQSGSSCNKRLPVNYLINRRTYCDIFINSNLGIQNVSAIEPEILNNFKIIQVIFILRTFLT